MSLSIEMTDTNSIVTPPLQPDEADGAISSIEATGSGTAAREPAPHGGFRDRVASGAALALLQMVGSKIVSMAGQLALARLLLPREFGTVALAYTIYSAVIVLQQLGLGQMLIERGKHFGRWANAAFWIAIAVSSASAVLMLAVAPAAGRAYHDPTLPGVVAVLALSVPLGALSSVAGARLQQEMRFRKYLAVTLLTNTGQVVLSVILAVAHFGVYSFVLPRLIVNLAAAIALWKEQAPFLRLRPHLRRWRFLLADGRFIFMTALFTTGINQGDYASLGLWHAPAIVGFYYFGFNLSIQLNTLFTQSMWAVLLPALSRIRDNPTHLLVSYIRAARVLAIVSTPFCLLLVALAGPVIRVVFGAKWEPAIRVIQFLAAGMTISVVGTTGHALLQALGRFRDLMVLTGIMAAVFLATVAPAAALTQGAVAADRVAGVVGTFNIAYGLLSMYVAVRPLGGGMRDVVRVFTFALIPGALSIGSAALAGWFVARAGAGDLVEGALTTLIGLGLYTLIIRRTAPAEWMEIRDKAIKLAARFWPGPA